MKLNRSDLKILIEQEIKKVLLREGTWESPNTVKQAKKLKRLYKDPIYPLEAKEELDGIIGDDTLYDDLSDYEDAAKKKGRHVDLRPKIAKFLKDWVFPYEKETWTSDAEWDPKAVKIVKNIVKEFTDVQEDK